MLVQCVLPSDEIMAKKTPKQQVEIAIKRLQDYQKELFKELKEVEALKIKIAVMLTESIKGVKENEIDK